MNLEKIQEFNSLNEIYDYIIVNSCTYCNVNKNLKNLQELHNYNIDNYNIYLTNDFINTNKAESSLDYLIISNSRNYRNIMINDTDLEDAIQDSRVDIFFLMEEYLQGKYDREVKREFDFEINGDIKKFKLLFLKKNVDKFCSHLLIKSKQRKRKSLDNRLLQSVKDSDGKWKAVATYITYNISSIEEIESNENYQDIDKILYKINGDLNNKEIENYRSNNIYSYINNNLDILTKKQKVFIDFCLNSRDVTSFSYLFKSDDEYMTRQQKCSYKKNIVNRVTKNLLEHNDKVNCNNNGCYTLKKCNFEVNKIFKSEYEIDQFKTICSLIKKNNSTSEMLIKMALDYDCFNYFTRYIKSMQIDTEIHRFLYSNKFKQMVEKLKIQEEYGRI